MQLHHHDYESSYSSSESGPETQEPQDSSDAGTLTDPPQNVRAAPPSGEPRQLSEPESETSDRGS